MVPADHRTKATRPALGKMSLLAIAASTAAAWFWIRRGEEPLQRRTAERLAPRRGTTDR